MKPHSINEVIPYVYGGNAWAANLTGRISELRGSGYIIECWSDKENSARSWYQMKGKKDTPQMADWKRTKIAGKKEKMFNGFSNDYHNEAIKNLSLEHDSIKFVEKEKTAIVNGFEVQVYKPAPKEINGLF